MAWWLFRWNPRHEVSESFGREPCLLVWLLSISRTFVFQQNIYSEDMCKCELELMPHVEIQWLVSVISFTRMSNLSSALNVWQASPDRSLRMCMLTCYRGGPWWGQKWLLYATNSRTCTLTSTTAIYSRWNYVCTRQWHSCLTPPHLVCV